MSTSDGAAARYVHRRPVYDLVVDGQSINVAVNPRLESLSLTEKRGADADELEIILKDHDGKLAIPSAGAMITLKLGWLELRDGAVPQLVDKGSFKVDERCWSGTPDVLTIRAKSADLTRAFRTRRSQTWSNTTLGAVLNEIAARNALEAAVAADKASIVVDHLTQGRESDSALLARLGRLHDAVATVKAQKLLFASVGAGETAGGQPIPPATITRRKGDGCRWESAERENYSGVTVEYHDRGSAQRRQVTVGSATNPKKLGRTYASERSARRAAEAHQAKQKRKVAKFSITLAIGDPTLYPERKVTVSGFKPEIDHAEWLIVETSHRLDGAGGLKTSLQMELGAPPATTA
ncbi:phage late control protein [Brevundimonas intermedia]|uniref:Phage late control protein n=1 Tax=Brevundimonas intermedia TaxID=74315 RepID=A0ABQ5TBT1_9CAUL|nr:contractile injection system protein, VgrG/Pvc8 family [Brevundimonas intermedia]GLK49602.1 phage late control protein [Brevundimonas intermedia]